MAKYVVTHGNKFSGPDPGMTPEGFEQDANLRHLIPDSPSEVWMGTGQRHKDVAQALGLLNVAKEDPVFGKPDSLEVVNGKKVVLFADGSTMPLANYPSPKDDGPAAKAAVESLSDNAVACAGRPFMIALGIPDAKSAAVYAIEDNGAIEELVAIGQSEAGTV